MEEGQKPTGGALLEQVREDFALFMSRHPAVTIDTMPNDLSSFENPWNDESVAIYIPHKVPSRYESLRDALNSILLPERFSALYHIEENLLEVIWTAYKLPDQLSEVVGRSFVFNYNGVVHKCYFSNSSAELISVGREMIIAGFSDTGHRNLKSFEALLDPNSDEESLDPGRELDQPLSFFITDFGNPESDEAVKLVQHLNFYLKYFDSRSPLVRVHEVEPAVRYSDRSRYVDGVFPPGINAQPLNQTLISFWLGAASGDASRRFLNYFRIIEYVSFYYVDASARAKIARMLANPNSSPDISMITDQTIEILRENKADDYARFKATVLDLVKERHIVREVANNESYFSSEIEFEGGFKLKPFVASKNPCSIGPHGMDLFVTVVRDIRNALSHGRDQKTGQVILPTSKNLNNLQPWVELIATAAAEVVLYEGIH